MLLCMCWGYVHCNLLIIYFNFIIDLILHHDPDLVLDRMLDHGILKLNLGLSRDLDPGQDQDLNQLHQKPMQKSQPHLNYHHHQLSHITDIVYLVPIVNFQMIVKKTKALIKVQIKIVCQQLPGKFPLYILFFLCNCNWLNKLI